MDLYQQEEIATGIPTRKPKRDHSNYTSQEIEEICSGLPLTLHTRCAFCCQENCNGDGCYCTCHRR